MDDEGVKSSGEKSSWKNLQETRELVRVVLNQVKDVLNQMVEKVLDKLREEVLNKVRDIIQGKIQLVGLYCRIFPWLMSSKPVRESLQLQHDHRGHHWLRLQSMCHNLHTLTTFSTPVTRLERMTQLICRSNFTGHSF